MRTVYIGPLVSVNGNSGKEVTSELQVEPSDPAYGSDKLAIGIYHRRTGTELRTAHLNREQATELRDALTYWLDGGA